MENFAGKSKNFHKNCKILPENRKFSLKIAKASHQTLKISWKIENFVGKLKIR